MSTLSEALDDIAEHGFGHNVDADSIVEQAAAGLVRLHDYIEGDQGPSAADTCEVLYEVLGSVGLEVS